MTRACSLAFIVASLCGCAGAGLVTWEDVGERGGDAVRPRGDQAVPPAPQPPANPAAEQARVAAAIERRAAEEPASPAPTAVHAPLPERVDTSARGSVALAGLSPRVDDGALFEFAALTLICLADARALTDTAAVFERLDAEAEKLGAKLGGVRLVRLVRDPARSMSDPPPRACRSLVGDAVLKAPLSREQEPEATWLITSSTNALVDDAARALARAQAGGHKASRPPRLIVDESGAMIALALPIERPSGGG